MSKTLSIIIPSYNAEKFMHKALNSYLLSGAQRDKLEVWIISDGSIDNTDQIALEYEQKYPDLFHLYHKENGGHGSAINTGAKLVHGKYMKVIDADDWVDQKGMMRFIDQLDQLDTDVVISDYMEYDITTNQRTRHHAVIPKAHDLRDTMEHWSEVGDCMQFWGVTYRTDFYRGLNYKLLEGVFYEDQEYATVPCAYAHSVAYTGTLVYIYRVGDVAQSVSGLNQVKRLGHLEAVIHRMCALEKKQKELAPGGARYWLKKTSMVVTSYYQVAMLKNPKRAEGRRRAEEMDGWLAENAPKVRAFVGKKYNIFRKLSSMHVSDNMYQKVEHTIMPLLRRGR